VLSAQVARPLPDEERIILWYSQTSDIFTGSNCSFVCSLSFLVCYVV